MSFLTLLYFYILFETDLYILFLFTFFLIDIQGSHITPFEFLCYQNIKISQETFLQLVDSYEPIKNTKQRCLTDYRRAVKSLKVISPETNQFLRLIIHSFPKQGITQRYYAKGSYVMKLHQFNFQDEIRKIDNLLYEAIGEKFISHFQFIPENNVHSRSQYPATAATTAAASSSTSRGLLSGGSGIKSFVDMSNIMNHMINNNLEARHTIYEYYEHIIKWERINFAIKSANFKVGLR